MWGNSPTSTVGHTRRLPGQQVNITRGSVWRQAVKMVGSGSAGQHSDIGHHPAVGSARCTVTKEEFPVVSGAPPRGCHSRETELPRLALEPLTQVNMPGTGADHLSATALHHFRTHFIAGATYANAAMHY